MGSINPNNARTAEDYVRLLQQVRAASEESYGPIEQRAGQADAVLDPSSLAQTPNLTDLPGERLVSAMLHAYGHGDEVDNWLAVHSRLAALRADTQANPIPDRRARPATARAARRRGTCGTTERRT